MNQRPALRPRRLRPPLAAARRAARLPGGVRPRARSLLEFIAAAVNANLGAAETRQWLVSGISQLLGGQAGALLLVETGGDNRPDSPANRAAAANPLDDSLQSRGELVMQRAAPPPGQPGDPPDLRLFWNHQVRLDWQTGRIEAAIQANRPLTLNPPDTASPTGAELAAAAARMFNLLPDFSLASMALAPLVVNEQLLGAIAVFNRPGQPFTWQDAETLAQIGRSVAQATYSRRLIQQLKVTNADLEAHHWQLLHSRNTLRALFDSIPTSIYIVDRKYNLVAVNMNRARRTRRPPTALVGKRCYKALFGRDDPCPDCLVLETLFEGRSTGRTKLQWQEDEEPLSWEISTYPIFEAHPPVNAALIAPVQADDAELQDVIQAIVLEQDVTEKRHLEVTLAQSEKLAAVGQLAAGIAHEINNPLTAVVANAQLLQRELPPDDDKQELVDLIARAGARAAQVVRTLLDLARKEQYDIASLDLNATISKALSLLQHEFVARRINLVFEPAADLVRVEASADHLQGVWINLISNAIDALDNPEEALASPRQAEIRITTRMHGSEARVTVADNGKGIPAEKLSRIFEPFYTTKAVGRGTGLGLSVCHRVIKQHGGRILVDSQPEVGTQFTVILPIQGR